MSAAAKSNGIVNIHGKEYWVEIPHHLGYQASNLGRIRSVLTSPRVLKPAKAKTGYLTVMLGRGRTRYVHHLVLWAFRGMADKGLTASHLNGKRDDNRPSNLAWETPAENCARRVGHGTRNRGERQGHARLSEKIVRDIKAVTNPPHGWYSFIARAHGVHPNTIRDIHHGRTWRHI